MWLPSTLPIVILEIQVSARNLLQACLCDLRLRRSHLIIIVLCVWFINAVHAGPKYM